MAEKCRALVTGATGFIGANLVRRLIDDGWETHVIVRPGSDLSVLSGFGQQVHVHEHDGSTQDLIDIVRNALPQVVFHLASTFVVQHAPADVGRIVNSNILFSSQLLEAMSVTGVRLLVNTGTGWQHYESRQYDPVCLYAASKQAFEAILTFYTNASAVSAISLKLNDTYGPCDTRRKLFTLLRSSAQNQTALPMSPGEQLIDLVYIDDVVDAYLLAARRLLSGKSRGHEAYLVTSGNPVMLKHLVAIYSAVTGETILVAWGARPYRSREVMVPWTGGQVVPEWIPKIKLEDGIRRMEACK